MKWVVVISLFVVASVSANKRVPKPIFAVYYESLCGDSRRFITRQLYPVKTSPLGEYFYVQLIPYGKATTAQTGDSYSFDCQHGPDECKGNKLHACAIRHLKESESFEFVYCSMSSSYPPNSLDECTTKLGLPKDEIMKCMAEGQGDMLLAGHGERTHSLNPNLTFVPWITVSGIFDRKKFEQSLTNFKTVVCKTLHEEGKTPEECEGVKVEEETAKQVGDTSGSRSSRVLLPEATLLQVLTISVLVFKFVYAK